MVTSLRGRAIARLVMPTTRPGFATVPSSPRGPNQRFRGIPESHCIFSWMRTSLLPDFFDEGTGEDEGIGFGDDAASPEYCSTSANRGKGLGWIPSKFGNGDIRISENPGSGDGWMPSKFGSTKSCLRDDFGGTNSFLVPPRSSSPSARAKIAPAAIASTSRRLLHRHRQAD